MKDNRRFDFDNTIYLDLFLNQNKDQSKAYRKELMQLKESLKKLKLSLEAYTKQENVFESFQTAENLIG